MGNSYIRDYILQVLDGAFIDELEKLKAVYYSIDYLLNMIEYERETEQDIHDYNRLATCLLTIKDIINERGDEVE